MPGFKISAPCPEFKPRPFFFKNLLIRKIKNMNDNNAPRVFFAANRAILACLRPGLAVIGLGFVVA